MEQVVYSVSAFRSAWMNSYRSNNPSKAKKGIIGNKSKNSQYANLYQ